MLTLRKQHYDAFRDTARSEFVRRMLAHLKEEFPEKTEAMSKAQLEEFVKRNRDRAEAYSITISDDIEYYIDSAHAQSEGIGESGLSEEIRGGAREEKWVVPFKGAEAGGHPNRPHKLQPTRPTKRIASNFTSRPIPIPKIRLRTRKASSSPIRRDARSRASFSRAH
jgi:hypothetical protein